MPSPKKDPRPGKPGRKPRARKNQPPGRAAARLRQAVENLVTQESDKIARALVNQTIAGNMTGARILTALTDAEKPIEKKKRKRRGPSEAMRLAMEPPWEGLTPEERERSIAANGIWCYKCQCPRDQCHVDHSRHHEDDPPPDDNPQQE
jgi:hypothetical protein